jgi:hypothetical protein
MDRDFGVADLRAERLENPTASIRVIALDGVCLCFGGGGYNRETRDGMSVAVGTRLGEFTSRHPLLPDARLEMMVVTHRGGQLWLEILQLLLAVIEQQPVEGLLVVWPKERNVSTGVMFSVTAITYSSHVSLRVRSCSLNMCHMERSCRRS